MPLRVPSLLCQKGEGSPQKKRRKEEEKKEVWKWWEEERLPEGVKWRTLEHSVRQGRGGWRCTHFSCTRCVLEEPVLIYPLVLLLAGPLLPTAIPTAAPRRQVLL